jgi:peptidoglycan/LPS O-acetylase OafA/YrhL
VSYRPLLDKVRWMSAALVAAGHAIAILNDQVHGSPILNAVAQMRSPAVIVFFVLSGYLVGGVVIRDFANFQLRRYALARFARIYIVLVPAVLLTVLIDGAVFHFDHLNPLFSQVWQGGALGDTPIFSRYTLARAIASVLCLEPLIAAPIGSAGSFWSLGNEWIYYFAFPALFAAGFRLGGFRTATVLTFASAFLVALVSRIEAAFWLVWLAGAYANTVDLPRLLRSALLTRVLKYAGFAAGIAGVALGSWLGMRSCIVVIGLAGFLVLAAGSTGERTSGRNFDKSLARFSYSLYVTHLQIMTLLAAILFRIGLLPRTGIVAPGAVIALALALLAISIAVACGFATLFEDRTNDFARWLNRRFSSRAVQTPAGIVHR